MSLTDDQRTSAFYDLVWPHRAAVLRVAGMLSGGSAEAEDLAQDTLLKAFRSIERFTPGTDAKSWLMTILRNTRIDRLRSATTGAAKATISLESLGTDPADDTAADGWDGSQTPQQILDGFADRDVIRALQELPDEIRWTLLLVDVEGVNHDEAAAILDVPAGTIKSRAHRGRAMLRASLLPLARDRRLVRE